MRNAKGIHTNRLCSKFKKIKYVTFFHYVMTIRLFNVTFVANYFCVCRKNRRQHNQYLHCYFSKYIYTRAHETKHLHIETKLFTVNILTSCAFLFSRNSEKTHTDQSILTTNFFTQSEKKTLANLQK